MSHIQSLSDELISQIAAGEVVERPASVVKELVENSLDAGATKIAVDIEEGGLKSIRIVDNGVGILRDEARLAFQRHATSKIRSVDDLFKIHSLGFRGEALASIASIARVLMQTRHKDERVGSLLEIDGGQELRFEESACDQGTDIKVLGLFHHTPARKKYMKTERTEYGRCFELLSQIALAHPQVGFKLKRDGQQVFDLPAGQSLKERVRTLYGNTTAEALVSIHYQQSNLVIQGFVGKPELARKSKKYQFVFVNGRSIESRVLHHAVKEAFHSLLMHEKHPWYVLDIQMDPSLVDVNVHPRKLEVKFVNQQEVFRAVRGSVHHALEGVMLSPVLRDSSAKDFAASRAMAPKLDLSMAFERGTHQARDFAPAMNDVGADDDFGSDYSVLAKKEVFTVQGSRLKPVAQIAYSYIVAEGEDGLVLIDQHAAHERVRYAQLMESLEKESPMVQPLLTPLEMDLGLDSARLVEEYREDFEALGFEVEAFGGSTFLIRSVPAGIAKRDPETVVKEILADITQEWKQNHTKDLREHLLTYTACRGAIKFGDPLTMIEMQALLEDMEKTKHCTHCPHGRPALVTLTFDKLETLFKRKNF